VTDRLPRVLSLRAVVVRWQLAGLFVGGLQSLLCFSLGALLTGRFAEVWAITDRFAWLPWVPALVLLLWPIMAAWLVVPRAVVPTLRGPLVAMRVASAE
jgi:hypothetical protein